MTTLAPPFTYYGGKIRTAQWIFNHLPAHGAGHLFSGGVA